MIEAPGATAHVNPLYISKKATYGCALIVILCLGCLFVGGMGLQGYLDQASLPIDVKFIVMMAVGGTGVIASLVLIGGLLWSAESRPPKPKPRAYVESSLSEPGILIPDEEGNFLATPENLQALGVPYFCHEAWQYYLGEEVEPIPLPRDIQTVLGKNYMLEARENTGKGEAIDMGTYRETHALILIPRGLDIDRFVRMLENRVLLSGYSGAVPWILTGPQSRWILVPKNKRFVVDRTHHKYLPENARSTILEALIGMATYRIVTGQHLYPDLTFSTKEAGLCTMNARDAIGFCCYLVQRGGDHPHFAPYRFS